MSTIVHALKVFIEAVRADRARAVVPRIMEADFLPATLEVTEKPVSPTLRATGWVLLVGLALTCAWLFVGKVDVVATAPGRIVPVGAVKSIQSASTGVVRAIYVQDGAHVRRGQALLDLDPTLSGADLAQTSKALQTAEVDVARNRTIADLLKGRHGRLAPTSGEDEDIRQTQQELVQAQVSEVTSNIASLNAARLSALQEARAAQAQADRLAQTTPILDKEINALLELDTKGYAPGLRLLDLQRERAQEVGDRQVALAQRAKGEEDAARIARQIADVRETAQRSALGDLAKAQSEAIVRREDVVKAGQRSRFQRLVSPVSGRVQQLAVHTLGGVVEAAQTLLIVVPDGTQLEAEVQIRNQDVGFIHEGQAVALKVDAFPFTRYGTVPGRIAVLSRDAVASTKTKSAFVARVALERADMIIDERSIGLTPGLTLSADVLTGKRRIIEYLLSPLAQTVQQAGRER